MDAVSWGGCFLSERLSDESGTSTFDLTLMEATGNGRSIGMLNGAYSMALLEEASVNELRSSKVASTSNSE
jgi:hypothetical protein